MNIHRRGSFVIPACAAVLWVCLSAPPAGAQAVEKKTLTVLCDNGCNVSLQTFTVPVGQTASQFQFSFETSWQPCQGVDRMDWIVFGIRGPMGNAVYECTEFWDKRPPRETPGPAAAVILGPGTYTVYLVSGRNTTVWMSYALTVGAKIPAGATEAKPVTVYRDGDCTLYPGGFRVEPGCTALGFRFSLDTPWLPCSGTDHVDEVTFVIRGPEGKDVYEYRAYYDRRTPQERLGSVNNLTLGPGNYVLLLGSGQSTTVKLNYVISCGPAPQAQAAAPGYEPADLIAVFETDFKSWYVKTGGTGNASVYRLGSDLQGKKAFTWDDIAKDVISNNDITLLKPGRIFLDAEFRMEDRSEYQRLYAVGTPYTQIWKNDAWVNHPPAVQGGWMNYIGYCGTRPILPSEGFKYTGKLGGSISVLGPGLAVPAGKFRVAVLSAIATDWVAHFPSKGKIYVYFIPDE